MKEVTYEEWQKNPTPRMMWVWDNEKDEKQKKTVLYFIMEYSECFKNMIYLWSK